MRRELGGITKGFFSRFAVARRSRALLKRAKTNNYAAKVPVAFSYRRALSGCRRAETFFRAGRPKKNAAAGRTARALRRFRRFPYIRLRRNGVRQTPFNEEKSCRETTDEQKDNDGAPYCRIKLNKTCRHFIENKNRLKETKNNRQKPGSEIYAASRRRFTQNRRIDFKLRALKHNVRFAANRFDARQFFGRKPPEGNENFLHLALAADVGERAVAAENAQPVNYFVLFQRIVVHESDRVIIQFRVVFELAQNISPPSPAP
jgi:hypothetical protein